MNKLSTITEMLTLSARMQDELEQCGQFLGVCFPEEEDEKAVYDSFLADFGISEKLNKNDSKKALSDFKAYSIRKAGEIDSSRLPLSKDSRRLPLFSKVYIEEDIELTELPERLQDAVLSAAEKETIHHYKDIFNAKGNDFLEQKYSGGVILAKNRDKLFYKGAPFCQSFGNEHFYYTSCVKNCIYDCSYCYLRGMYPCGYVTVFVNLNDYFSELEEMLATGEKIYLCVSYDTDLLALENLLGYCRQWIKFAEGHQNLKIEIRTKCGNERFFKEATEITDNVIFAWTLSPDSVSQLTESGMPTVMQRLQAARAARNVGFPVRFCFDPMIYHGNWREHYEALIKKVFTEFTSEEILDVSVGVFRISNNYLRRMRNIATDIVTTFPYVTEDGACHYGELSTEMQNFALEEITKYYPKDRIYTWM